MQVSTYTSKIKKIFESKEKFKQAWKIDVLQNVGFVNDNILDELFETRWHETMITYENSVRNTTQHIGALKFINEVYDDDKIIVENGVLFQNSRKIVAPTVETEIFLFNERKRVKKKGNYYLTIGNDPVLGAIYDNLQKNIKITMNTYYGVLTNPFSRFYNRDLGDSITCRGRSSISVSALAVEGAFAKRIPKRVDALFTYWSRCINSDIDEDILKEMVSFNYTAEDYIREFNLENHYAIDTIRKRLNEFSKEEIAKIIFKNNFNLFSKLPSFQSVVYELFKMCALKETPFLDPNELPFKKVDDKKIVLEEAKYYLDRIKHLVTQVLEGMYWYGGDYIQDKKIIVHNTRDTIANIDRFTIPVIDTDSNFLSYETEFRMIYDIIRKLNDGSFTLKESTDDNTFYTISNFCATIMMQVIDVALDRYKSRVNILPEKFDCLKLKNEFLFTKVLITSRKKNYLTVVALKEGKPYPDRKLDVKGLPFMKSSVNQNIGDATKDVVKNIMMKPDTTLQSILEHIRSNSRSILKQHGNDQKLLDYCVTLKVKTTLEETDKSDYRYKMVTLWNSLVKKADKINTPASFYSIPIKITKEFETEYPEEYQKIVEWLEERNVTMIHSQIENIMKDPDSSKYKFISFLGSRYRFSEIDSVDKWNEVREETMKYIKDNKLPIKSANLNIMELKDIDKIGFPVFIQVVPDWLMSIVNDTTSHIIINNLIAPIVQELHLVCPRNSEDKRIVTNILDIF